MQDARAWVLDAAGRVFEEREREKSHDSAGIEPPGCDVSLGNVSQREHAEEGLES